METTLTYEQAYHELQDIALAIQDETVAVDELSEKLKRAAALITFCQEKLRTTESEVNNIIKQMESRKKTG